MFRTTAVLVTRSAVSPELTSQFIVCSKSLNRCGNLCHVHRVMDFYSINPLLDRLRRTRRGRTKGRQPTGRCLEIDQPVSFGISFSFHPWNHCKKIGVRPDFLKPLPLKPTLKWNFTFKS
jgi:hypothetical protein